MNGTPSSKEGFVLNCPKNRLQLLSGQNLMFGACAELWKSVQYHPKYGSVRNLCFTENIAPNWDLWSGRNFYLLILS